MQRLEAASEEEVAAVKELLLCTMPDARVLSVQRNQHDLLYRQFEARRSTAEAEAGQK